MTACVVVLLKIFTEHLPASHIALIFSVLLGAIKCFIAFLSCFIQLEARQKQNLTVDIALQV